MSKVAIIGPGLLGGSIALALRERSKNFVSVWGRRAEAIQEVRSAGIADFATTDIAAAVNGADLAVLCTPIGAMPAVARQVADAIPAGALVTDVGSVKTSVVAELSAIFAGRARFIGSHPMAGSEQTGLKAARANLFNEAVCIVTPPSMTDPETVAQVTAFWQLLGCTVRHLSPLEHDEVVALVSHLPHLLAAALISTISARHRAALAFCGPGFRDTTRVASGPPAMWAEILHFNHGAVRKSTEAVIEKLHEIITLLDAAPATSAMQTFLTQAKTERDRLSQPK